MFNREVLCYFRNVIVNSCIPYSITYLNTDDDLRAVSLISLGRDVSGDPSLEHN